MMRKAEMPQPPAVQLAVSCRAHYPGVGTLILIWAFIGAATSLRILLTSPHAYKRDLIFLIAYIACYMPWGFLTALTFRLEERFPLGGVRWPRHAAALLLASLPVSLIGAPSMRAFFVGTLYLLGHPSSFARSWTHWFYELFIGEFFFWLSVAGAYSIRTHFYLQQQKEASMQMNLEKSRLEASLNQAQLDVLRAKLNPHFLFNSLQNISVLTREDPVVASRMLVKLGDLLRAVLRKDSQAQCTLQEEVDLLHHYMALEQMRFGDRLGFEVSIERGAKQALVPSFLLQPLIENAIVHGLRDVQKEGLITIHALALCDMLIVTVRDNGRGFSQSKPGKCDGLGLSLTRERLAGMFPGRHAFTIDSSPLRGTEVRIEIPFVTEDTEDRFERDNRATTHR